MTSQQIHYIITLADEGSFSKAAKKLYVSQPSLSQFVKNLENQIGITLFDRSSNPIKLTEAGRAYYDAAQKIQQTETILTNQLSDISGLRTGQLTIGTSPFRASCMLAKSLSEFNKKYPGIKIKLITDAIYSLTSSKTDDNIDIYIENNIFQHDLFYTEELSTEKYYLAVPKLHPFNEQHKNLVLTNDDIFFDSQTLYANPGVSLESCTKYPFIMLNSKTDYSGITRQLFRYTDIKPEVSIYANAYETMFYWTYNGLGMSILPDTLIKFGNFSEHPIYYKISSAYTPLSGTTNTVINDDMISKQIVAAYKRNRYLTSPAREYILLLKQLIGLGTWKL